MLEWCYRCVVQSTVSSPAEAGLLSLSPFLCSVSTISTSVEGNNIKSHLPCHVAAFLQTSITFLAGTMEDFDNYDVEEVRIV